MKTIKTLVPALFLLTNLVTNAQVGIGTNSPASSAQLDISSTTRGLLPPRMTHEQRDLISSPVAGLMVWCSNCGSAGEMQVYNGTTWTNIVGGVATADSTIQIGTQLWTSRNLEVTKYRNGDNIPQVTDNTQWRNLTTGAWCYFQNDITLTYGKLYNGYAVHDPRGLAPAGWHIPSDSEWTVLTNYLGGEVAAGDKIRATGNVWPTDPAATNSSGFTAFPSGYRDNNGNWEEATAYWWTSTFDQGGYPLIRFLFYYDNNLHSADAELLLGLSVRCIKD